MPTWSLCLFGMRHASKISDRPGMERGDGQVTGTGPRAADWTRKVTLGGQVTSDTYEDK